MKMKTGIILAMGWLAAGCAMTRRPLTLAEGGAGQAVIVVGREASEPERHAASELADFLRQATGATFEILTDAPRGKSRILVGPEAARMADANFSTEGLGSDGIVIRTRGRDLILAGGRPRGTLYAVYTFLEDDVGFRWWTSTASAIPRKPTLKIEPLDVRYTPVLEYREPFWTDAFDGDWAVRNKYNGGRAGVDAKRGGKHVYEGFVHTFYSLIPPDRYFDDHPEWFSEIDGKRRHDRKQLCLTNESMRRELVKNLKERLRANPEATIASVSQNDWHGYCECDLCAAADREEGSHAGSLLRFVNAVAADIEDEFPHVAISTLAYQYTRKPPLRVKPRPNVIVRLCSIECSFSKPLDSERNKDFRDDMEGWSRICDRLYVWDYVTNFRHYFRPHPNLRVLGPNIRFFVDHGVKGVFEQGAYTTRGAEMAELRAWVLAKLLWNPALDDQALIDEFLDGYYGPAGRHVRAYIDLIHDAVEVSGDWIGCLPSYSSPPPAFLSFATLSRGWRHLEAAEAAVSGDPELLNRVRMVQLPVMYAFVRQWKPLQDEARRAEAPWPLSASVETVAGRFMEIARKNEVTRLNEWQEGFGLLEEAVQKAKN